MIRQRISKTIILLLTILSFMPQIVLADDIDIIGDIKSQEEIELETRQMVVETNGALQGEEYVQDVGKVSNQAPIVNSRRWVIYERGSQRVLEGKNEEVRGAMASTTKIMTAIVVIENADLNQQVSISSRAAGTGGSRLGLQKGDSITIKDLLYGLMMRSGNDAAIALAEEIGGTVSAFIEMMNQKAINLNLINTHFVTPHGLDHSEHYTTASELARLTDYALSNDIFRKIVGTKTYTVIKNGYPLTIHNTNELLGILDGVVGVKTGFTNGAGRCLVTETIRGEKDLIVIVLGADTKKDRTRDSIKLIEYAFSSFREFDLENDVKEAFQQWNNVNSERIEIERGQEKRLNCYLSSLHTKGILLNQGEEKNFIYEFNTLSQMKAPVTKDQKIGTMTIKLGDEIIEQLDIMTANGIEKKQIEDYICEFCRTILGRMLIRN